jgi:hypothetical protein
MNYFHIIRKRLITLGLKPQDARTLASWFNRQVQHKGLDDALKYFKNVGDTLIGYISKSGYKAPWVATTKGGYPRSLVLLKSYPLDVQLRVAKLARAIFVTKPTTEQVSKLKTAATSTYGGSGEALTKLGTLVREGLSVSCLKPVSFVSSPTTALLSARMYTNRSVPNGTEVGVKTDLLLSCFNSWKDDLVQLQNWWELFYPLSPSYVGRYAHQYGRHDHVGQLSGVMEQGGKLRIFAAPNVVLNNALEPLQLFLDRYRMQCIWDVFKEQEASVQWVLDKMNSGAIIDSIDLSSATCRFPFEVQLEVCELLGAPPESINLYRKVARGTYKVSKEMMPYFGSTVTWTVGQPLGANPSMSSFALTHGLLLAGLCSELGISPFDSFRIMGDDVVTCSHALALRYREIISSLGISISEHKSYSSNEYAEFAGFSITKSHQVRPGRWKAPNNLNIVGLISDLGAAVVNERIDDPTPALLMAFRNGSYIPSLADYSFWIRLNTLLLEDQTTKFDTTSKSWYDGMVRFLQKELTFPYFVEPSDTTLVDLLPDSELKRKYLLANYHCLEYLTSENIFIVLELLSQECHSMNEHTAFMHQLRTAYEAFTWSRPITKGRAIRTALEKIERDLDKLESTLVGH